MRESEPRKWNAGGGIARRSQRAVHAAIAVCGLVAALLAVVAPGADAAQAGLEYKGKLLLEAPTGLESLGLSKHSFGKMKLELSWTATASTETSAGLGRWDFQSLAGKLHWDTNGSKHPEPECTATLSEKPGGEDLFRITPHESGVEVEAEVPLSGAVLQSSNTDENSSCSIAGLAQFGWYDHFAEDETTVAQIEEMGGARHPRLIAPPGGPWSAPFNAYWTREIPAGAGDPYLAEISSTLTVGTSGPSAGGTSAPPASTPPAYGPEFNKAKSDAEKDMRTTAIPNAERFCLPFAGGLAMTGAGVLTGSMIAIAGSITSAALAPFCTAAVIRLVKDYKTFNDPPLQSIDVLAEPAATGKPTLPACTRYRGRVKGACAALRSAYASLDSAASRVAAVTVAIEETVSREHAAYDAHDQGAVNSQDAQLATLFAQQSSAERQQSSAGKVVASVLRSARISFTLTKKQSAKVVASAQAKLAAAGVTASELRAVDPGALIAATTNLLTDLSHL